MKGNITYYNLIKNSCNLLNKKRYIYHIYFPLNFIKNCQNSYAIELVQILSNT